jgi:hypothetical protein
MATLDDFVQHLKYNIDILEKHEQLRNARKKLMGNRYIPSQTQGLHANKNIIQVYKRLLKQVQSTTKKYTEKQVQKLFVKLNKFIKKM